MKIERKNGNREGWGDEERPGDRETERREGGGEDIHQDESESEKRSNETKRGIERTRQRESSSGKVDYIERNGRGNFINQIDVK